MLKIILVRHGEEKRINSNGVEYQTNESPLISKGMEHAKKLALRIKREKGITEIFSSDIRRALQTAEIVNREIGLKVQIDKRLRERNIGELEKYGNKWRKEFDKLKEIELARGIPKTEIRPPGGESIYDFRDRIRSFLIGLSRREGTVVVSAHRGVNTAIISFVQNWNCREFRPIEQNHTCINILTFENNQWNILAINDISHLN